LYQKLIDSDYQSLRYPYENRPNPIIRKTIDPDPEKPEESKSKDQRNPRPVKNRRIQDHPVEKPVNPDPEKNQTVQIQKNLEVRHPEKNRKSKDQKNRSKS
jgi:hypothetical protein